MLYIIILPTSPDDGGEDDADAEERKRKTLDVVWEQNDTRSRVTTYLKTLES